jgi:hypothetical protein
MQGYEFLFRPSSNSAPHSVFFPLPGLTSGLVVREQSAPLGSACFPLARRTRFETNRVGAELSREETAATRPPRCSRRLIFISLRCSAQIPPLAGYDAFCMAQRRFPFYKFSTHSARVADDRQRRLDGQTVRSRYSCHPNIRVLNVSGDPLL